MIDLVKYLVTNIVDKPESVNITDTVDEANTHLINITVDPEDMGKVIGKGGKIINAIRELTRVKAIKTGERVRVILEDQLKTDSASQSEPLA
jgi:uncharacterized protein